MTAAPLSDRQDRVRAATDVSTNLVVAAGAGTGKTSLLVERFLNLILSETFPLSAVAAITFTEKAAAEMNRRVEDALDAILHATAPGSEAAVENEAARSLAWLLDVQEIPRDTLHARARERMDRLEDAFTGTIHAFCSDLLRRHPQAADIPPEFSVDDGARQALAFDTLWTEFLVDEWGARGTRDALWDSVLAAFSEREIEDAARSLVGAAETRDLLDRVGYRPIDARETLAPRIRSLVEDLTRYLSHYRKVIRSQRMITTALFLFEVYLEGGPEGLRNADASAFDDTEFWDITSVTTLGVGFPEPERDRATLRIKEAIDLLKGLRRIHEQPIADLMEVLRPFARRFREHIGREGLLSFDDLLLLARNLLADYPGIREAESGRFRQILVDEFQDTDPLQYEIVFLLASRETGPVTDPYATALAPGKLFIVGDPKQSIYRFRGADIAAYLRARDHVMDGGNPASLTVNFRSRPGILDALNPLFADWMGPRSPDEADVEPPFEPIRPHRESLDEPCVRILSVETEKKTKAEYRRRAEAVEIARRIREWTAAGVAWGDIAVLFRSLVDIPLYTRALREAGIDFVVDGGRAFFERHEVGEAFSLLRALANPADGVATVGVLRGSLGGVPDADLVAFVRAGGRLSWKRSLTAAAPFPAIRRVFERLQDWDALHDTLPLDRWILRVLTESEFTLLLAAYYDGPQRVANVRKLAEKAAGLARERGVTLEQVAQRLEEEFTGDRVEGESPLADEAVDAVRILTMHKAKGLEFPYVIIPDLGRKQPNERRETRVRPYRNPDGVFIAVDVANRSWLRNAAAVLLSVDQKRHDRAELKRVFYVAATRAKERLLFVNSDPAKQSPWLRTMADAWGYAYPRGDDPVEERLAGGLILHQSVRPGDRPAAGPESPPLDVVAPVRDFTAASETARAAAAAVRFRSPTGDERARELEAVTGTAAPVLPRDVARATGVAVHRLLETWDFRDAKALRDRAAEAADAAAAETGADGAAVRAEVGTVVKGLLASALPRRLAQAVILGREVPILFRDAGNTTVFGYADLLYRWEGTFHVADYKTDAETTPEQAERYRGQLTDYGDAVKRAWNLDAMPVLEILFLRTGERIPLPPAPPA